MWRPESRPAHTSTLCPPSTFFPTLSWSCDQAVSSAKGPLILWVMSRVRAVEMVEKVCM